MVLNKLEFKMKSYIKIIAICLLLITTLPLYGLEVNDYARISGNNVIVRGDSSTKGEYIGKLSNGNIVDILEVGPDSTIGRWGKHNWYKVFCNDNKTNGWVFGAFVKELELSHDFTPSNCEIIADNVMMRKSGSAESTLIKKLNMGDLAFALVEGEEEEAIGRWGTHKWYKIIEKKSRKVGWVFGAFLKITYEPKKTKYIEPVNKNYSGDRVRNDNIEYEIDDESECSH
jgi:hypothetical protein